MFVAKPKRIALTLLCSLAVVLALTSSAEANPQHRDHVVLHRMIKKRADNPFLNIFGNDNNNAGSVGAASDPPSDNASSSSTMFRPLAAPPFFWEAPALTGAPLPFLPPVAEALFLVPAAAPDVFAGPCDAPADWFFVPAAQHV